MFVLNTITCKCITIPWNCCSHLVNLLSEKHLHRIVLHFDTNDVQKIMEAGSYWRLAKQICPSNRGRINIGKSFPWQCSSVSQ